MLPRQKNDIIVATSIPHKYGIEVINLAVHKTWISVHNLTSTSATTNYCFLFYDQLPLSTSSRFIFSQQLERELEGDLAEPNPRYPYKVVLLFVALPPTVIILALLSVRNKDIKEIIYSQSLRAALITCQHQLRRLQ